MNRYELEIFARRQYGSHIGWMANVINNHYSSPTTKLKGLLYLSFHDRVCSMSGTMDLIMIDGYSVPWTELEKYAYLFSEREESMRLHISQCPQKTAFFLQDAKLLQDPYHDAIQEAAQAIVSRGPDFFTYEYQSSTSEGMSTWKYETANLELFIDYRRDIKFLSSYFVEKRSQ